MLAVSGDRGLAGDVVVVVVVVVVVDVAVVVSEKMSVCCCFIYSRKFCSAGSSASPRGPVEKVVGSRAFLEVALFLGDFNL